MKIHIEINLDNDAFVEDPEGVLADTLMELGQEIVLEGLPINDRLVLKDINGNTVGLAEVWK